MRALDAFQQLNTLANQKRRLKTLERTYLLGGIEGLTRTQMAALPDLEYHINFLQPGPNGALRERTLLVFRDVALVLAQEKGAYVLKETVGLRGAALVQLEDTEQYDNALKLGNTVMCTVTAAERDDALASLAIAIKVANITQPAEAKKITLASDDPVMQIVQELQSHVWELRSELSHVHARLEMEIAARKALESRLSMSP